MSTSYPTSTIPFANPSPNGYAYPSPTAPPTNDQSIVDAVFNAISDAPGFCYSYGTGIDIECFETGLPANRYASPSDTASGSPTTTASSAFSGSSFSAIGSASLGVSTSYSLSSSSSAMASPPSPTPMASIGSSMAPSPPVPASSSSSSGNNNSSSNVVIASPASYHAGMMPVIGGVVGGLLVLLLGGLGWWYIRRRRRRGMSWDRNGGEQARMVEGLEKGYAVSDETLRRDVEGAMLVIDLADIVETHSNSASGGSTTLVDHRSITPTQVMSQAPRAVPRATLAPATGPADASRPSSIWTDDSEADAMAVDGSSYTRTLSTASSSTSTLHGIPLSPGGAIGTYFSARSMTREDELDHPGYTYVSTSSRARPSLFGIETNSTAISPATTMTNPFRDSTSPISRPSPAHRLSPSPPYSAVSPTANGTGTWQSFSGSGSGSGHSTGTQPSYATPPTTVSSHSPITPTNGGRRIDPFADPPLYAAATAASRRSRESLGSIRTERSEIPPAYTALYGEDGLPRQ